MGWNDITRYRVDPDWILTKGEGIIRLTWTGGADLWTRGLVRGKLKRCAIIGNMLRPGVMAWRPITNGSNWMHRISDEGMERLKGAHADPSRK